MDLVRSWTKIDMRRFHSVLRRRIFLHQAQESQLIKRILCRGVCTHCQRLWPQWNYHSNNTQSNYEFNKKNMHTKWILCVFMSIVLNDELAWITDAHAPKTSLPPKLSLKFSKIGPKELLSTTYFVWFLDIFRHFSVNFVLFCMIW